MLAGNIHELLLCLVGLWHALRASMSDTSADYAVFALPHFDPNDYANAILAGEPYPPQPGKSKPAKSTGLAPASEDVSVAISKLTFSLDDVEKQLKNVVSTLLPPAATAKIPSYLVAIPSHGCLHGSHACYLPLPYLCLRLRTVRSTGSAHPHLHRSLRITRTCSCKRPVYRTSKAL